MIMPDCLFCKIAQQEIAADIVYQTDTVIAFNDIHPKAPQHILVIPKKHIASLNHIGPADRDLLADILLAIKEVATIKEIAENGYRVIVNTNNHAGQEVDHLHFHVLGGRNLGPMVAK